MPLEYYQKFTIYAKASFSASSSGFAPVSVPLPSPDKPLPAFPQNPQEPEAPLPQNVK